MVTVNITKKLGDSDIWVGLDFFEFGEFFVVVILVGVGEKVVRIAFDLIVTVLI